MNIEKILKIEVTHVPHNDEWGDPAHIRVTGYTEQGSFTLRKIEGLSTERIIKKIEVIRRVFKRLEGTEIKVMERTYDRGDYRAPIKHRIAVPSALPDWARGKWQDIVRNNQ